MKSALHSIAAMSLLTGASISATSAHAAGVTAGTLIQNTASATYNSGTASKTVTSNTVTVKVDELLNVAVATLDASPVSASSASAVLTYKVTNSGNGAEAFSLTANPAVSGNAFDGTIDQLVVDSNGNGVYDAGVDTVLANGAASPSLAADGTLTIFVLVSVPNGAADGASSQVRLTATAVTGSGSAGTVFVGQGAGGGDAVVGATTASSLALDTLIAKLAKVAVVKSALILDPFGTAQPVPGAVVTYSLKASVTGSGEVLALHITDGIPAGTTYQAGSLTLNGTSLTDASDSDAGVGSSSGIDATLGTMSGGSSSTVTFKVKIN